MQFIYLGFICLLYSAISFFVEGIPNLYELSLAWLWLIWWIDIYISIFASLSRVLMGLTFWIVIWLLSAYVVYRYKYIWDILQIIIEATRPVPPIAWIPLSIIFFGIGNTSSYFIVFLWCFFPIYTNTLKWFRSLPEIIYNTTRTYSISWRKFILRILLPYSLPYIFTGIKIWVWTGWMSVIAAEIIATQAWLWYFIQINRLMLNTENIIIWMVLIWMIGYFLVHIISRLEHLLTPWQHNSSHMTYGNKN